MSASCWCCLSAPITRIVPIFNRSFVPWVINFSGEVFISDILFNPTFEDSVIALGLFELREYLPLCKKKSYSYYKMFLTQWKGINLGNIPNKCSWDNSVLFSSRFLTIDWVPMSLIYHLWPCCLQNMYLFQSYSLLITFKTGFIL